MQQRYRKIFWGLLVVIFNINIGPINILPDFIGYFMISFAISDIINEFDNKEFRRAKKIANILALYSLILSFADIIGGALDSSYNDIVSIGLAILISSAVLVMSFNIFSGTIELYLSREMNEYYELTVKTQRNYTKSNLVGIFLMTVSINIFDEYYTAIAAVYIIATQIYFAAIINRIKKSFNEDLIEP